ncbi:hypothetical protein CANARDRAFT_30245 [[Candida] arabinofermentans NRRL YB-2248]|uniref:NAD-dependent epimerase/dehydratase domain-containing protein n=1 Tax=[Candida] arabinofermentans NRRL YB-2248 TaxID=983967 RepID=A0A1E4SUG6_9ASCO|nr:hypothetical protein CANARDRAFT_30245 [[Candida] arabinofermentans NRRL YB-2248]
MTPSETTVFISGATGYIAKHVIDQLLSKGYTVVGTVRSTDKGEKLLKQFKSNKKLSYEVVSSLEKPGAFDDALIKHPEVTIFLHTASPVTFSSEDPVNDVFIPAVEGTKNAMTSIKKHAPQVTTVVMTSSVAAVINTYNILLPGFKYNENSWNPVLAKDAAKGGSWAYRASKAHAEALARKFVDEEKPNFKLTTICPSFVFGPQLFDDDVVETMNFSAEIINSLLKLKKDDEIPMTYSSYIDVRDTAKAHIVGFENEKCHGTRLIISEDKFESNQILKLIHDNYPQFKVKIPQPGEIDVEKLEGTPTLINDTSKELVGFKFIKLDKLVTDTVDQFLRCQS